MDVAWLFGVVGLIFDFCVRCKNNTKRYDSLARDLNSLATTLQVAERYLPYNVDFQDVRQAIVDTGKVLSRYTEPSSGTGIPGRWSREVRLAMENIEELRNELDKQHKHLDTRVMSIASQGLCSHPQLQKALPLPNSAILPSPSQNERIWIDIDKALQDTPNDESRIDAIINLAIQRSTSYGPPIESPLDELSPSTTTDSLFSHKTTPDYFSDESRYSLTASEISISSKSTKRSERPNSFMSFVTRAGHNFVKAAKKGDLTALQRLRPRVDDITLFEALVSVIQTERVISERLEVVKYLVSVEVCLEAKETFHKRTPLISAIANRHYDIAQFLIENGASTDTRDGTWDWTPLVWAIYMNNTHIVQILVDCGADLQARDVLCRRTPLLWAAKLGNCPALKILLEKDRNLIAVMDKDRMSPAALAYGEKYREAGRLLNEYEGKPNG